MLNFEKSAIRTLLQVQVKTFPGQLSMTTTATNNKNMSSILQAERLPMAHWRTLDPFLFCAYHKETYPQSAGTGSDYASLGVDPKHLRGRDIGSDFSGKNGFSMYHGDVVPGFPSHPHFGFETVTVVREGRIDHFDSHGATARYGDGDAQWLTAGAGIQHCEMFPLVNSDKPNPLDLFQIWLNLPKAKKRSKPFFAMAWATEQPRKSFGEPGKQAHLRLVGGNFAGLVGVPPPPDSYASDPKSEIVIATLKMEPGSTFTLPAASSSDINRAIYLFTGSGISVDGKVFSDLVTMVTLQANKEVELKAVGSTPSEILFLQGRPIKEPVAQHGPFVCNTREELVEVSRDFHRTQFGGWKWGRSDPVHPRDQGRFFEIDGVRVDAPKSSDESCAST